MFQLCLLPLLFLKLASQLIIALSQLGHLLLQLLLPRCWTRLLHSSLLESALQKLGPLTDEDLEARLPRTRWRVPEALARLRVAGQDAEIRFDAVGVSFDRQGRIVDIEHLRAAF